MKPANNRILMFGTLPPPVGGVTVSVKNLTQALQRSGNSVDFLSLKMVFKRYAVAHIHCYSPWKRLILLLLGKCFASKNVFTIHGMHYQANSWLGRMNIWLTDGVVVLNDKILQDVPLLTSKNYLKATSLVKEGMDTIKPTGKLLPEKVKPRLLLYAQHGDSFDGEPIYGVPFIKDILPQLVKKFTLVVADINNSYPELSEHDECDVIHIDSAVNFMQLLDEVDVYIRPTSKDGDAVSIYEALIAGVPVVASNVVERPQGVTVYRYMDKENFLHAIDKLVFDQSSDSHVNLSSVTDYVNFYKNL